MSEKRLLQDYFNDILESITDTKEFTCEMSFEDFAKDRKTIKAVVRSLEVIGEAANNIPKKQKQKEGQVLFLAEEQKNSLKLKGHLTVYRTTMFFICDRIA